MECFLHREGHLRQVADFVPADDEVVRVVMGMGGGADVAQHPGGVGVRVHLHLVAHVHGDGVAGGGGQTRWCPCAIRAE